MIEDFFNKEQNKVLKPTYLGDKDSTNATVVKSINEDKDEHLDIVDEMKNFKPMVEKRENDDYNAWLLARE